MTWTNRVVWQEGMFLRAQHFQQQDRWTGALVRGRAHGAAAASLGAGRDGDRPRPAGDRPVSRCIRRPAYSRTARRLRSRARPTTRRRSICPRARATRSSICRAGPPGRRGRGRRRQRRRRPLRCASFEAYDTHSASPQPAPSCRSAGCACATCSRPRSAPDICASGSRASSRSPPTGASPSTIAGSRRASSVPRRRRCRG